MPPDPEPLPVLGGVPEPELEFARADHHSGIARKSRAIPKKDVRERARRDIANLRVG